MEPDSSRQQSPDMLEREEMASTTSSELQLRSPQRSPNNSIRRPRSSKPDKVSHPPPWEEDLQPEDSCSPAKKIRNNKYIPHQNINNRLTTKKFYEIDSVKENLFTYSCLTYLLGYRPSTRDLQSYRWRAFSSIPIQVYPNVMSSSSLLYFLFFGLLLIFQKQTSDKTDFFAKIIPPLTLDKESSIDIMLPDEHMRSVFASQEEKQYAFAIAYLKDGNTKVFPAVVPDHPRGGGRSASVLTKKHSEEILIQQIDDFLLDRGNEVKKLLVYSYNSPCLRRENNTTCCMFLLLQKADDWHSRYGFFTEVTFTKFWGLTGPNFFKHLTYSDISNLGSVFFPYIEKCKNIRFKLNEKELRNMFKNGGLYKKMRLATDKTKLSSTIKSTLHKLVNDAKTSCRKKDHLDRGTKIITSPEFPPEVREEITALKKKWKEFIINESMSPIRKKINMDFNNAVVQLFVKKLKFFWGDSSPLKLYQVSQNMEGEGEYVQQIREL